MSKWGNAGNSDEREQKPFRVFGECQLEFGKMAFVKGQGAVPYDPSVHKRGSNCMIVRVFPVMEMNWDGVYERAYSIDSGDWVRFVRPSIFKATGLKDDAAFDAMNGGFVALEDKPTGVRYKSNELDENDKPIYKNRTAANFLTVFNGDDRQEKCGEACKLYRQTDDDMDTDESNAADDREPVLNIVRALHGAGQAVEAIQAAINAFGASVEDVDIKAILES